MIRQNRKVQFIILLTLVCLVGTMTVAYAVLSTTLSINGTAQVMDASWNVHFENIEVNPNSVAISPKITDNDKITFQADLTTPGQFYKFTVDIVNEGSIDAMIETIIKNPSLTTEQKKYLRYEVEYIDGTSINEKQLIKANETKTISVLVSYRNDIPTTDLPTTQTNLDLEIRLVYVQATSVGTEVAGNEKLVKVISGDYDTVGSEICIKDECFYVISSDSNTVTMFAKYNLLVGYKYDSTYGMISLENPTGIQDEIAIGWFDGHNVENPIIGSVKFSKTNYWSDITTHPSNVYNENSNLYEYVENYKTYLEKQGVLLDDIRLITIEELYSLGCSKSKCTSAPSWVYSTTYWTMSSHSSGYIYNVYSDADYYDCHYQYQSNGIRPVIVINKMEF